MEVSFVTSSVIQCIISLRESGRLVIKSLLCDHIIESKKGLSACTASLSFRARTRVNARAKRASVFKKSFRTFLHLVRKISLKSAHVY